MLIKIVEERVEWGRNFINNLFYFNLFNILYSYRGEEGWSLFLYKIILKIKYVFKKSDYE